ncbi:MAG: 3'-5' exonuclease [Myxococcota bacterium]
MSRPANGSAGRSSSKGLTVRATIIAGLDANVLPREGEDQGEARRLLYVAMTRSKEHLFVTFTKKRTGPTARAGSASLERRLPCPTPRWGTREGPERGSLHREAMAVRGIAPPVAPPRRSIG